MSQAGLAAAIGTSIRSLKSYEAAAFAPRASRLKQIARTLHFPEAFFSGDGIGELLPEAASIRASSKRTANQRDRALGSAAVAIALNQAIEQLYALPEVALPVLRKDTRPERAADIVRMQWSLGDKPIERVVQLLESKGVRVFSLPADAAAADTFSMWYGDRPFMLLNHRKTEDQLRLDAVCELGHLLLHRDVSPTGRQPQEKAITFASAFLVPAEAAKTSAAPTSANDLTNFSARWGLPPAVVAHRLHKLGRLSAWKYREHRITLEQQTSADQATGAVQREKPQLLQRAFHTLRAQGITKRKLTRAFHIYLEDVDALTFGLATTVFGSPTDAQADADRLRPRLRIVSST